MQAVSTGVVGVIVVLLVISAGSLIYAGTVTTKVSTTTSVTTSTQTVTSHSTSTQVVTTTATPAIAELDVIPDWGGSGYDAFVVPSSIGAEQPMPAAGSANPGPNNANLTVSAGVPTRFVISNLDTAVLVNFTGQVTTPLSIYNDTAAGQVAAQYQSGQTIQNLPISHTFTISTLGLNIPIPPDSIVSFTYTFNKPGVYMYICTTPCGPAMSVAGYMIGYVIVK